MNIETVPVQILVVGFGILISVLAGLNLYILNKNANDVTKAEGKTTTLESNMNTQLEKKVDKSTNQLQYEQIIKGIKDVDDKLIALDSKLDSTITDLAFQKGIKQGEDNMRRELAKT